MRWTQLASGGLARQTRTQAAYGEVVWSWRRDRGVYFAGGIPQTTVTINAAHRGEHEGNRQTIARGKPGCLGCTCLIRVRFLSTIAHGAAGAVSARLSLRPLFKRGTTKWQNSGKACRGNANVCDDVIPGRCAASNPESRDSGFALRAPRNDRLDRLFENRNRKRPTPPSRQPAWRDRPAAALP